MTAAARKVEITVIQAHLAATWMMVGVIWFVQVCHYPLFPWIPEDAFQRMKLPIVMRQPRLYSPRWQSKRSARSG